MLRSVGEALVTTPSTRGRMGNHRLYRQLTAYSLCFAALRSGFRQQLKAGVLPSLRSGRMRELSSELLVSPPLRCGENQEFEQMPLRGTAQLAHWATEVVSNRKGEKAMTADRKDHTPREVTADSQGARLFAWRRGFNAMHLIDLGVRLGLFKAFADTPLISRRGKSQTGWDCARHTSTCGVPLPIASSYWMRMRNDAFA